VLALAPAGGPGAQPALTPFQQQALRAIYAVLPYQRERFALSVSQDAIPVTLYSDAQNIDRVECASNAGFKILSQANDAGVIAVSVCPEHVARLRAMALASAAGFDTTLATIQKGMPPLPADKLRAAGWYRERSTLPGGAEQHYVAVLAVGHGVIGVPTVVLLTDTQAVVAQAEATQLCGEGGNPFPLCADPKGTLSAIAQRLLR
jgi:hypothetical protein